MSIKSDMSEPKSSWLRERRLLIFWNRFWLSVLVLAGLIWGCSQFLEHTDQQMSTVTTAWGGDALRFTSMRGDVVITHLVGVSGQMAVEAPLPRPLFLLDSGSVYVKQNTLERLDWRDESGNKQPPPPIGNRIVGLYSRPVRTRWKGKSDTEDTVDGAS